jgi:hypothetical protein
LWIHCVPLDEIASLNHLDAIGSRTVRCPPLAGLRSPRCAIVSPRAVKIEAVSKVSTLRKLGVVARVAGQQAGRSRTLSAVMSGARTTARSFGHAAHQLWLEVTGTVFLAMALFGAAAAVREYMKYAAGHTTASRVAITVCFTLAFAWFGLSSFWKVKRKSQHS